MATPESAPRRAKKKQAYHHGNLGPALVEAAVKLIEEHGVGALTLRETARLAGVSHNAPYRHFADKRSLLAAVAEDGYRTLVEDLAAAKGKAKNPGAAIRALGVVYVQFGLKNPGRFRVMFGPEVADKTNFPGLAAQEELVFGMLTETVAERLSQSDDDRPDPLDYVLAAWSSMHGLTSLLLDGQLAKRSYGKEDVSALTGRISRILRKSLGS